jgi:hypothetical protein
MSRRNAPQKTISTEPQLRRRSSKRLFANALAAARNAGMAVRFKMRTNGEIDIVFGKPADDEPEDLTRVL